MRRQIARAYPKLNEERKTRYNERQRARRGRGFTMNGDPIKPHGIRRIWKRDGKLFPRSGTCLVCSQPAGYCICSIVVRDEKGEIIGALTKITDGSAFELKKAIKRKREDAEIEQEDGIGFMD